MKTKYVKLFEEFINESVEQELLTDPVKIKEWIDSWKDEIVNTYVSKDDVWKKVPRLNGTYTIRPDGTVDVVGGVYLQNKKLEIIPIQFGKVTEDFNCSDNSNLTSLLGCPTSVGGDFNCAFNILFSLQYCPTSVGGNFNCSDNSNLTSLLGCPTSVGGHFYCHVNNLTSLQYCPTSVDGNFSCSVNPKLTSLQGCPTSVGGHFSCSNNPKLTSLQYCPTSVGGDFSCFDNKLKSLQYAPTSVGGSFSCSWNQLTTLQYCPTSVGGNFECYYNSNLITKEHNSKIKGDFIRNGIEGTLEERILRYIEYLKPLDQQERDSSLDWLGSVEKDLHKEVMDYITKNNIDVISGRVKSIYNKTNTQNKRMPLM